MRKGLGGEAAGHARKSTLRLTIAVGKSRMPPHRIMHDTVTTGCMLVNFQFSSKMLLIP